MIAQSLTPAAFADAAGAASWLSGQPQANAPAMLGALCEQIEAFNALSVAPRERFAALEALRTAVHAVAAESQRRYEFRALPLLAAEQTALVAVVRLWRACAVGYRLCLRPGGERDALPAARRGEAVHRALCCLRFEQTACYAAGSELSADFWPVLHALWADAERLECTRQVVADRVPRETEESTPSGQYAMSLLLHLADPYTLSRAEFAATRRWWVRWRELVRLLPAPAGDPASRGVAPELAATRPVVDAASSAAAARWISLRDVQRKMRQRLELLAAGQSPQALKLGGELSAQACAALLRTLDHRLGHPPPAGDDEFEAGVAVRVAVGVEACHQWLRGGADGESEGPASSFASQLAAQQLAVFGHVVRPSGQRSASAGEGWQLVARDGGRLRLVRPPQSGGVRLARRGLLMLRAEDGGELLATVSGVRAARDARLFVSARCLAGRPAPVLVEARDRHAAQALRYPAIVVAAASGIGAPQVFIAAGWASPPTPARFYDLAGNPLPALRLDSCLESGADGERWTLAP